MSFLTDLKEALRTKTGTQLAAVAGGVMTFFTVMPGAFGTLIGVFPEGPFRIVGAILVGAFTFGIPAIAQMKDDKNVQDS